MFKWFWTIFSLDAPDSGRLRECKLKIHFAKAAFEIEIHDTKWKIQNIKILFYFSGKIQRVMQRKILLSCSAYN